MAAHNSKSRLYIPVGKVPQEMRFEESDTTICIFCKGPSHNFRYFPPLTEDLVPGALKIRLCNRHWHRSKDFVKSPSDTLVGLTKKISPWVKPWRANTEGAWLHSPTDILRLSPEGYKAWVEFIVQWDLALSTRDEVAENLNVLDVNPVDLITITKFLNIVLN